VIILYIKRNYYKNINNYYCSYHTPTYIYICLEIFSHIFYLFKTVLNLFTHINSYIIGASVYFFLWITFDYMFILNADDKILFAFFLLIIYRLIFV